MIGAIEDTNNMEFSAGNAFKKSVLLVDDDLVWQSLLTNILTRDNEFEVVCVSNLREAKRLIKSNKSSFHIAVVDVNLDNKDSENIDGFRLLEEMLRIKHPARTIVLDHHLDAVDRLKRAYDLKAVDYFDKTPPNRPFNEHKFMDAVRKAVEQSGVVDVFAIMPFDLKYWNFYENAIKAIFEEMKLSCKRSDEIFHRGVIMKDILRFVRHAKFIVADLSGGNPNVLFEIGIAHAIQKPVILLTRNLGDVPAIIQDNIQVFDYDVTLRGGDKLHNHLMDAARKIQIGQSPVILEELIPDLDETLCLGLVPKYQSEKSDAYTYFIKHVAEKDLGFNAKHLEEVTGSGSVIVKCWEYINRARIVVADLTGCDSRVYYWSGVTYGLEKEMVTIAKEGEKIPFDLRGVHRIDYSMNFKKGSDARDNLKNAMKLLLERKTKPESAKAHANTGKTGSERSESKTRIQKKGSTMPKKKTPAGDVVNNKSSQVKVFINHATEDKLLVKKLYSELKKYPWIDTWIDEENLLPGQDWGLEIEKAMKESDAVLVCISRTSVKKIGYVQAEIRKAEELQKLRPLGHIFMIPVLLEKCQVPNGLQKYQWVDLSEPGNFDRIIKSLETLKGQK